ncbi:hypothetical protein IEO21_10998 [Rhodonia placenta]|uniref:Uncharacterized protein n=1 Tax=Rhodonia placenta TaxID=104341 RepID=A0A8H7NRC6_9APHY|nr:hypothetical protein IEO21_10998 [Postia placenta]
MGDLGQAMHVVRSWFVCSVADAALGASESAQLCKQCLGCAMHCHPI